MQMSDSITIAKHDFYENIKNILRSARENAYKQVNFIMVEAYWNIGKQIVEEEQNGKERAEYGKSLIADLSKRLTSEFGRGFSKRNLWNMRQFYLVFPKVQTLSAQLTWSHYQLLLRIENSAAREWYMNEAIAANWSVRALERQIGTHYYERLLSSKDKALIMQEASEKTKDLLLPNMQTLSA